MKRFLACLLLVLIPASVSIAGTYGTISPPPRLLANACVTLFVAADGTPIASTTASQQFEVMGPGDNPAMPDSISFELIWSGNPGAFNIQIQDADTDATGNYVTLTNGGTITTTPASVGGTYVSRAEFSPWRARYGRLYVNTQAANAVTLTAKVCR